MSNHLIIGLGGTGGKILRAMRQKIYEEFGTNEPDTGTHISYIFVDSDEHELKDDASWKYLGKSVNLSPRDKVNIHGTGDGMTGQRRHIGHTLLENNIANDPNSGFHAVLRRHIIDFRDGTDITFHVCAGLAGGTGSGTVVDTVAQIHKIASAEGRSFEIYLYLYVPEIYPEPMVNVNGFYLANGYAALQEINAIKIGTYKPTDISGQADKQTGEPSRLLGNLETTAFEIAYVFSNTNEVQKKFNKNKELPTAVAEFLFQQIISDKTQNVYRALEHVRYIPPEKNAENEVVHARNFATFGIKSIVYPEQEIMEYAKMQNIVSTILGLLYNNWTEDCGFAIEREEEAGMGFAQEVRHAPTLQRLMLDDSHITLQTPVGYFAESDSWEPFGDFWNTRCEFIAENILTTEKSQHRWIRSFLDTCEKLFDYDFRGVGVKRFFDSISRQEEISRYAADICKHIEKTLFYEWVTGQHDGDCKMSLQKVRLYLGELILATRERIANLENLQNTLASEMEENRNECDLLRDRFMATGVLSNLLFGKAKKNFTQFASAMALNYTYATTIEAYGYARQLLDEIVKRLLNIVMAVYDFENLLREAGRRASDNAEALFHSLDNCKNGNLGIIDKVCDPGKVNKIVEKGLRRNAELQHSLRKAVLKSIMEITDEADGSPSFRKALYKISSDQIVIDHISAVSQRAIENRLQKIAEKDGDCQLLGVNILEQIKQECPTQALLDDYLQKVVDDMKPLLSFNYAEVGKVVEGQYPERMVSCVQLCLPAFEDGSNFRERFIDGFAARCPKTIFNPNEEVLKTSNIQQITITAITGGFPLRYVENVDYLKKQYDTMTSEDEAQGKLNKMLLHTESLGYNALPNLYIEEASSN